MAGGTDPNMGRKADRKAGAQGLGDRLAFWRAGRARAATAFTSQPEPRTIGLFGRGKQLIAGNFLFAGHLVEAKGCAIWDVPAPDPGFAAEIQGFGWLDDLAAVGDAAARGRAQGWTWDWIARFGAGSGPGWAPELIGRRLIRWIDHAPLLLAGRDKAQADAYFRLLSVQTVLLSRRWQAAGPGLPRFEALTGLISAGLALEGMEARIAPALAALEGDCATGIEADGGISTRNPEELLEVFTLLTWATRALIAAEKPIGPALSAALERIAPCLRALRHADGGLARFHGGGRGVEGRIDQALAASGVRPGPVLLGQAEPEQKGMAPADRKRARQAVVVPVPPAPSQPTQGGTGLAMGFARLAHGRTTVIVDAAPPPAGRASRSAHASTLAFELTSGRRPLITSCGPGAPFGADWGRAARATASHSTLCLDGYSSSRLGEDGSDALTDTAAVPLMRLKPTEAGASFHAIHAGWEMTHGLLHGRELVLSADGRWLAGYDTLDATSPAQRRRFERILTRDGGLAGPGIALRFHLHPDVDAALDLGGTAVSLMLKSGEIWVFRHDSAAELSLEPSVHLERGRLKPRPARQIVLSMRVAGFHTRIGWTLAKAQDTPLAIRDLERDDLPLLP